MKLDLNRHPETQILIEQLRAVSVGAEIGYHTLSLAIGRDVKTAARPRLASARQIVERDHGICFFSLRGQGLRRVRPEEVPAIGATARRRIRSTSRNGLKSMTAVLAGSNGVDGDTMRQINTERAALGLLQEISSETTRPAFVTEQPIVSPAHAGQAFLRHIGALKE